MLGCVLLLVLLSGQSRAQNKYQSGIQWLEPPVVTPGKTDSQAPSDAVVLFDGTNVAAWEGAEKWEIRDGVLVIGKGPIDTKQEFGDCQLHLEWPAPDQPDRHGHRRGNSGVKLLKKFEIQILNSFENPAAFDVQAGAVYKQTPPMVNAMRPPNQWNSFDIFWTSPKFKEDGTLQQPAYVTIVNNGVLVANHFELKGAAAHAKAPQYISGLTRGPIQITEHGSPIRFRNIWVRETSPAATFNRRRQSSQSFSGSAAALLVTGVWSDVAAQESKSVNEKLNILCIGTANRGPCWGEEELGRR